MSTIKVTPFPERVAKDWKTFLPIKHTQHRKASHAPRPASRARLPLHEGSGLCCRPHCLEIQSLYVATSSVTLIILPNMLHGFERREGSVSATLRSRRQLRRGAPAPAALTSPSRCWGSTSRWGTRRGSGRRRRSRRPASPAWPRTSSCRRRSLRRKRTHKTGNSTAAEREPVSAPRGSGAIANVPGPLTTPPGPRAWAP